MVDTSVMRRTLRMLGLAVELVTGSVIAWTIWAEIEYGNNPQAGCPFGTPRDGPWLPLAVALSVGAGAAMGWALWRKPLRPQAVVAGVLTGGVTIAAVAGVLTGGVTIAAIFVAFLFVAAPLRCFD